MWVNRDFESVDPGGPLVAAPAATAEVPFALREGQTVAAWEGAQGRGETGLAAVSGTLAYALFEVPALPDFSAPRFPDLAGLDAAARIQRVADAQAALLTALHVLGPPVTACLRYRCEAAAPGREPRVRCFFVGRAFGQDAAEAAARLAAFAGALVRHLPPGYPLRRCDPAAPADAALAERILFPVAVAGYAEALKPEQLLPPWHDPELVGIPFWYYPLPFAADADSDGIGLCRALTEQMRPLGGGVSGVLAAAASRPALLVDVTLAPAPPLTPAEQAEAAGWAQLAETWSRDQRVQTPGGLFRKPETVEVAADPQAGEAKKGWSDVLARYGGPGQRPFLAAVRALALGDWPADPGGEGPVGAAKAAAAALATHALAAGAGFQLVALGPDGREGAERAAPAAAVFAKAVRSVHGAYVTPAVCNRAVWEHAGAPETLRRVHRLVSPGEAAPFFRLPIPGRDGCPGIPLDAGIPGIGPVPGAAVARTAAPRLVEIGQFVEGGRVTAEAASVPVDDLAKHALIVGTPGSGKTSLAFHLLTQLWRDHRVPFLVLEPAKTEYRALLEMPGVGADLLVFTVGGERVSPFRLNLLEVPDGVPVAEHQAAALACLAGAFSLPDPLPLLLDEAIRDAYAARGWSEYGVGGEVPGGEPPTLRDLHRAAAAAAARSGYRGDAGGNIRAMLDARLGALLRGPKGRCFGARRSLPAALLLERPVVLELEGLTDEEKALAVLLVLTRVRAHARANRRSGAALSHVTLVEEAHNVLGAGEARGAGRDPAAAADPKGAAARYLVRMLAEVRALGEGVLLADQLPTALAPEAVKTTGLKVMHRLPAADDREVLGKTMALDPAQTEQAAALPPGLSLVFREGWVRSRLVAEPDVKARYGVAEPPADAAVRTRMADLPARAGSAFASAVRDAFLPYAGCGAVCARCDGAVRERLERWAVRQLPVVADAVRRRDRSLLTPDAAAFAAYFAEVGGVADRADPVQRHCAFVHFAERALPEGLAAGSGDETPFTAEGPGQRP